MDFAGEEATGGSMDVHENTPLMDSIREYPAKPGFQHCHPYHDAVPARIGRPDRAATRVSARACPSNPKTGIATAQREFGPGAVPETDFQRTRPGRPALRPTGDALPAKQMDTGATSPVTRTRDSSRSEVDRARKFAGARARPAACT